MNTHKRLKNLNLMKAYHDIHGNLFIPPKFIIPEGLEWPVEAVGFNLGQYANHIRQQTKKSAAYYDPLDVQVLTDLGFVWDLTKYKSQIVLLAAQTYKKLHNTLDMKHKFEVPKNDDSWPEITWGLKLQGTLQNIKNLHIHSTIHDELKALGLNIPSREKTVRPPSSPAASTEAAASSDDDSFVEQSARSKVDVSKLKSIDHIDLLTKYKTLYGDLLVPIKFEVPDDEESAWPKSEVGFALGDFVKRLRVSIKKSRTKYRSEDLQKLADLGFVWDLTEYKTNSLLQALRTYKSLHDHVDVQYNFVVPAEDPWPRATWGYKLGSMLNNIRYNCSFQHVKKELLALGVDYTVGQHGGGGGEGGGSNSGRLFPSSGIITSHTLTSALGSDAGLSSSYRELRYFPTNSSIEAPDSDSEGEDEALLTNIAAKNGISSARQAAQPSAPLSNKNKPIGSAEALEEGSGGKEGRGFRAKKRKADE